MITTVYDPHIDKKTQQKITNIIFKCIRSGDGGVVTIYCDGKTDKIVKATINITNINGQTKNVTQILHT
jgi:hypothetical protein